MVAQPFLKWAGGKRKLVPAIEQFMPPVEKRKDKRLIEPFCGAMALSLAVEFDEYILNDINPDLINTYITLKEQKNDFIDLAESYFTEAYNNPDAYYELRALFNLTNNKPLKAALFIYLNRHCFNGLCRYNRNGGFNVPFGKYKSIGFPRKSMEDFLKKADRMQFFNEHFVKIFELVQNHDILYCDPPYLPIDGKTNSSFTDYSKDGFNLFDQQTLATLLTEKRNNYYMAIASNHDTVMARELYYSAVIHPISVSRSISASGAKRKQQQEILAVFSPE